MIYIVIIGTLADGNSSSGQWVRFGKRAGIVDLIKINCSATGIDGMPGIIYYNLDCEITVEM